MSRLISMATSVCAGCHATRQHDIVLGLREPTWAVYYCSQGTGDDAALIDQLLTAAEAAAASVNAATDNPVGAIHMCIMWVGSMLRERCRYTLRIWSSVDHPLIRERPRRFCCTCARSMSCCGSTGRPRQLPPLQPCSQHVAPARPNARHADELA